jgi:hypothetical protein
MRDSGGAGVLTADFGALEHLGSVLKDQAGRFESEVDQVRFAQEHLLDGAGQFAGQVGAGIAGFAASWRLTFTVCAASTRLAVHNVGRQVVDLQVTDGELAGRLVL